MRQSRVVLAVLAPAALLTGLVAGPVSAELVARERWAQAPSPQQRELPPGQQRWVDEQQGLSEPSREQPATLLGPATVQGRDVELRVHVDCADGLVQVGASVTQQTADGSPVTGTASSEPVACGEVVLPVPAPGTAFGPGPAFVTLLVTRCRADRCEREQVISSATVQEPADEQVVLGDPTVQVRPVLVRVVGRARPVAHVSYRCAAAPDVHGATARLHVRTGAGLALVSADRPALRCDGRLREVTFRRPALVAGVTVLVIEEQRCRAACGGSGAAGSGSARLDE